MLRFHKQYFIISQANVLCQYPADADITYQGRMIFVRYKHEQDHSIKSPVEWDWNFDGPDEYPALP
ncbi:MAG: hypothetical protein ACSLE0_04015 [Chitinophagaceae bacterium]